MFTKYNEVINSMEKKTREDKTEYYCIKDTTQGTLKEYELSK